jgi:hypothetical protein
LVWLTPALLFNIDWTGHASWQTNAASVFMILGSALFIEGAMRLRSWALSPLCVVAALFLVYVDTKQATRVLSMSSEAASEAKMAEVAGESHLASQRSQLLAKRDGQTKTAGETAVGVLEAELRTIQLSDLRAWNATAGCEDVTAKASAAFCSRVASAKGNVEAAKARDKIDKELAKLPAPKTMSSPGSETVADAYVANVVTLLREAGFKPSERLVKAEEAMSRALGFELLAALGPTCWLAFINVMAFGGAPVSAAAARLRKTAAKTGRPDLAGNSAQVSVPVLPDDADDLDRCIADLFDESPAGVMKAREIRPLVQAWFGARGRKLVESKLWERMGQRFKYDNNHNRPRYMGLKPRAKGPPRLAVVAGCNA